MKPGDKVKVKVTKNKKLFVIHGIVRDTRNNYGHIEVLLANGNLMVEDFWTRNAELDNGL